MKRIAIIGGGLAGCAAAWRLKQAGHEPVIYEAGPDLAFGASGNAVGLYNPRFAAEMSPQSVYYAAAFRRALGVFPTLEDIDFDPSGCLHMMMEEKKRIQFSKMVKSWGWSAEEMRIVSAAEASEIAGIEIAHDALYLPQSGAVSPRKLCAAYADGVEVRYNTLSSSDLIGGSRAVEPWIARSSRAMTSIKNESADAVILACGSALRDFPEAKDLTLQAVRGQVTMIKDAAPIKAHLCYSGYVTRGRNGRHMVGSTFDRWADHGDVLDADDTQNLDKLAAAIPAFPSGLEVVGQRASMRTTSRDYFPVVGRLCDNLYVSTAHGSHGIVSSLMAAEILCTMIDGQAQSLPDAVIKALSPSRFIA